MTLSDNRQTQLEQLVIVAKRLDNTIGCCPLSLDIDVVHGYMSGKAKAVKHESESMKEPEGALQDEALKRQEAPVYQVFTFLAEIFFLLP